MSRQRLIEAASHTGEPGADVSLNDGADAQGAEQADASDAPRPADLRELLRPRTAEPGLRDPVVAARVDGEGASGVVEGAEEVASKSTVRGRGGLGGMRSDAWKSNVFDRLG
jgi:hypothetical protein